MEIVRLAEGVLAPSDTDCIKINVEPDGRFTLVASALMACGDGDDDESVAMVGSDPYPSFEAAEAAGLAWAEAHCVETIYVETGGELERVRPAQPVSA
ncbi:MAG: hypothetical protein EOP61_00585 [Sphingomonadales bacterium]|nr:MAG: hypothetical protein EOP61_00585 [Sphingomonadales bacterium]